MDRLLSQVLPYIAQVPERFPHSCLGIDRYHDFPMACVLIYFLHDAVSDSIYDILENKHHTAVLIYIYFILVNKLQGNHISVRKSMS